MSIHVVCECGKEYRLKREHVGRKAKCPMCGRIFRITASAAPGPPPVAQPASHAVPDASPPPTAASPAAAVAAASSPAAPARRLMLVGLAAAVVLIAVGAAVVWVGWFRTKDEPTPAVSSAKGPGGSLADAAALNKAAAGGTGGTSGAKSPSDKGGAAAVSEEWQKDFRAFRSELSRTLEPFAPKSGQDVQVQLAAERSLDKYRGKEVSWVLMYKAVDADGRIEFDIPDDRTAGITARNTRILAKPVSAAVAARWRNNPPRCVVRCPATIKRVMLMSRRDADGALLAWIPVVDIEASSPTGVANLSGPPKPSTKPDPAEPVHVAAGAPTWARIIVDADLFPKGEMWRKLEDLHSIVRSLRAAHRALQYALPEKVTVTRDQLQAKYGQPDRTWQSKTAKSEALTFHQYGPIGFGIKAGDKNYTWFFAEQQLWKDVRKDGFLKSATAAIRAAASGSGAARAAAASKPSDRAAASGKEPYRIKSIETSADRGDGIFREFCVVHVERKAAPPAAQGFVLIYGINTSADIGEIQKEITKKCPWEPTKVFNYAQNIVAPGGQVAIWGMCGLGGKVPGQISIRASKDIGQSGPVQVKAQLWAFDGRQWQSVSEMRQAGVGPQKK